MSLDVLISNDGAREAVMAALALPAPLGKLLVQYLALFRPAQRQLSFDRAQSLLSELAPMIEAARIERGGRTWVAPLEYWKAAIEEMLAKRDKLTLPLKSHGYLLEIIAGYANKAEGAVETKREQERAYAYTREQKPDPGMKPARSVMPDSVRKQLKQLAKGDAP
ncbi:MAG: hypothetical protein Q8L39_04660 [Burkholderiales bacterium]|nr:hypothetical protein [Burkholderiales bacterium]